MDLSQDRLTLESLLSDPLTQLVMRSDRISAADVAQAFHDAKAGLMLGRPFACGRTMSRPWMAGERDMCRTC